MISIGLLSLLLLLLVAVTAGFFTGASFLATFRRRLGCGGGELCADGEDGRDEDRVGD